MKNKLTSAGIIGSTLTLVMSLAPISPAAERAALPFAPGSAQAPPNAVEGADSNPVATSVQLSQNTAIVYHPPPGTGAPKRRVWAGARGPGRADLTITVLTPLEIAFTSRAQPTFYWFASRPITEPIEFVIMPEGSDSIHPLVRTRIAGGASAGINPISLEQLGVRLNSGRDYAWSVEVIFNPAQHSKNAVTTGGVRRIAPPHPGWRHGSAPPRSRSRRRSTLRTVFGTMRWTRSAVWSPRIPTTRNGTNNGRLCWARATSVRPRPLIADSERRPMGGVAAVG